MVTKKNEGKKPSAKGIAKAMGDKTPPKAKAPSKLMIRGHEAEVRWLPSDQLAALKPHEACTAFPALDEEAMETLTVSIASGYDEGQPIVADKASGLLVEGKHRRDILADLGWEAPVAFVPFKDKEEIVKFVVGSNLGRRHMTSSNARKQLREKLYKLGLSVTEVAKATGESKQTISASLKDVTRAEKEERNQTVQQEIAKGATVQEAAKKAGTSTATARRQKTNPTPPRAPASSKPMPSGGTVTKLHPRVEEVFKAQPANAAEFAKLCTSATNPVAYNAQLDLAKAVFAAMHAGERTDKVLGAQAIRRLVAELRPGATPPAPPAAAPASNVVPLPGVRAAVSPTGGLQPLPTLEKAIENVSKLVKAGSNGKHMLEQKTAAQMIGFCLDVHDEVGFAIFVHTMEAVTHLVAASFAEKRTQTREDRLKALIAAITPAAPAPAPAAPAAPAPAAATEKPATEAPAPAKAEAPAKAAAAPAPAREEEAGGDAAEARANAKAKKPGKAEKKAPKK